MRAAGLLCSRGVTRVHCSYGPFRLPPAVGPLPEGHSVIGPTQLPMLSHRGGEDLSSSVTRPCHHAAANHPAGVRTTFLPDMPSSCCLRQIDEDSASGARHFGATSRALPLRPGDSLTIQKMALSAGFRPSVSLLSAAQATRGLACPSAGLTPAERARVSLDAHRSWGDCEGRCRGGRRLVTSRCPRYETASVPSRWA